MLQNGLSQLRHQNAALKDENEKLKTQNALLKMDLAEVREVRELHLHMAAFKLIVITVLLRSSIC